MPNVLTFALILKEKLLSLYSDTYQMSLNFCKIPIIDPINQMVNQIWGKCKLKDFEKITCNVITFKYYT